MPIKLYLFDKIVNINFAFNKFILPSETVYDIDIIQVPNFVYAHILLNRENLLNFKNTIDNLLELEIKQEERKRERILNQLEKWEYFQNRGEYQYSQYVVEQVLAELRDDKQKSRELIKIIKKNYDKEDHEEMKKERGF